MPYIGSSFLMVPISPVGRSSNSGGEKAATSTPKGVIATSRFSMRGTISLAMQRLVDAIRVGRRRFERINARCSHETWGKS